MGFLSHIVEKRSGFSTDQEPPNWFIRWFGGGGQADSGVHVNEHTALNTLAVVACVRILAETVASLPLPVFERMEPRGRSRARNHGIYRLLHDAPNPLMTSFTWRERMMAHLGYWGNHYSEIERRGGDVTGLWPYHPKIVEPAIENGRLVYHVHENGAKRTVRSENMLHIPGLSMEGLKGLSPLSMMRQSIGAMVAMESYGQRLFSNDARPSVVLKHPAQLSDIARNNLRESWNQMHAGYKNAGKVGILEEGLELETIGMPPQDAQFLESRRFQVQELARFFRIPPHLLADVERSTSWGTGIEQQNIGFIVHTIRPWLVRIEQEFNRKLFPNEERNRYYTEFVVDGLLRGDSQTRGQFYNQMWNMGAMSPNDILEMENRNPIQDGDTYYVPMNMTPVGMTPLEDEQSEPERTKAIEAEWRTTLPDINRRSASARRRLANAHRAIYRDTIRRLLRMEKQDVGAAINRILRRRDIAAFEEWVREYYYERFPDRIIENMQAPVRSLTEAIVAEAADEVGSDPPAEDELDRFAGEYVDVFAKRHAGDSRSRLLKKIHEFSERSVETRQDDDLADILEDDLEEWDDRAEIDSHNETHRTAGAAAKMAYVAMGVIALRWVTAGSDPCDYCLGLNGAVVGTESSFLEAGQSFAPAGAAPFVSQTSIGHPPMHSGCECVIVPE